jgi:hypothetical protein
MSQPQEIDVIRLVQAEQQTDKMYGCTDYTPGYVIEKVATVAT